MFPRRDSEEVARLALAREASRKLPTLPLNATCYKACGPRNRTAEFGWGI